MLARIRDRVREGRWEVTASTWVEADRNLPNAESCARHFLYTRRYLADLLQIDAASLDLDYEPDTFGHHLNVPELLSDGGIRYYYHCRGAEGPYLYRWQAPSGRSIIAYREPLWYNWAIDGRCALIVPGLCRTLGLPVSLRVYGVGDHGGGPTRRDIERIIDMNSWPIFPTYRFGTYHDFFRAAEQVADRLPLVRGELNFIFDGCYTAQTRIKRGNRLGEAILFEAEGVTALTRFALGGPDGQADLAQAWKHVLFNQFHDILPGSGTVDTREYALGLYQQAFALANTQRAGALRALADAIDSSSLAGISPDERTNDETDRLSRSEGGGVGFPTGSAVLARTGRHTGLRRLFLVWNPLPFDREILCELTVWDWPGDAERMCFCDAAGDELAHQRVSGGLNAYWGHHYQTVWIRVFVPATGYSTVVLDQANLQSIESSRHEPRTIRQPASILENELVRVEVSPQDGTITSLLDKETGHDYVDPAQPLAVFRLIQEDASKGMTAWVVGQIRSATSLHTAAVVRSQQGGDLRRSIAWQTGFGHGSSLDVTLSLDQGERMIRFDVKVRWQEIGSKEGLPQLQFFLPVRGGICTRTYDVPMGLIDRPALPHDVPATSFALAACPGARSLMLAADSKYGFRGDDSALSLTLIRSSIDPDPWPEIGAHEIRLALALADSERDAVRITRCFCHPFSVMAMKNPQPGVLPPRQSLLAVAGDSVVVSGVKVSEDGHDLIVRFYTLSDQAGETRLHFWRAPVQAVWTDLHEQVLSDAWAEPVLAGNEVILPLLPRRLQTVRISF
jgi:alpha-mannosidase